MFQTYIDWNVIICMLIKVYIYSDIYNQKQSIKFSMHIDVNKGTLWWQKCTLVHILMTFVNILLL